ncbi:hypothetical protein Poly51_64020 [Rubripirellula tenax]|uniref:Uncharacterized protein n=1 Tax=Rubripirellula tenax TaxID=2528015 RepID=A0A5C6DV36_9BACT|nr:hypothetical protein Poly51_64020 [Rubripirellula tenax]
MVAQKYEVSRIIKEESGGKSESGLEYICESEARMVDCANCAVRCDPFNLGIGIKVTKEFANCVTLRNQVD